jgi:hypothetical protein
MTFWKLIDHSKKECDGDSESQRDLLRTSLEERERTDIVDFGRIFEELSNRAYTWDLWGAAYLIHGGCSNDAFFDFRGWLIAMGKHIYEGALKNADSLALIVDEDEDCTYEGFQYVAEEAWKHKVGPGGPKYSCSDCVPPSEPTGERWSEEGDDLKRRLPRLWKRFATPVERFVRVIATPPGESPPAIREAWVGCLLPLKEGSDGPERVHSFGVTSGKSEGSSLVFRVQAGAAVAVLEKHNPQAAQWWKTHAPHIFQPGKVLAFSAEVCELLPIESS